jgi:hypothetical protein
MTTVTITVSGKPFTANDERRAHFMKTARMRAYTRSLAKVLALEAVKPGTKWAWPVTITVADHCRTARLRDVGACSPHVKAILDGITDSRRIWPDDSPEYLASVVYLPPTKVGHDALVLTITDSRGTA